MEKHDVHEVKLRLAQNPLTNPKKICDNISMMKNQNLVKQGGRL